MKNDQEKLRVLILGATGMLGHKVFERLQESFHVRGTVRGTKEELPAALVQHADKLRFGVDALDMDKLEPLLREEKPHCVINCIGLIKHLSSASDPELAIKINALLPHTLARICDSLSIRFLHISTDCVFSGKQGFYSQSDNPDPVDLYGRSKLIGEVSSGQSLTLRTSVIGWELRNHVGLLEWFLSQRGQSIQGYSKAIYSGLSTEALAELITTVLRDHRELKGLWQVSAAPISKFDLLSQLNEAMDLGITISENTEFHCDRSLNSAEFWSHTGLKPPTWPEMINSLAKDRDNYDKH